MRPVTLSPPSADSVRCKGSQTETNFKSYRFNGIYWYTLHGGDEVKTMQHKGVSATDSFSRHVQDTPLSAVYSTSVPAIYYYYTWDIDNILWIISHRVAYVDVITIIFMPR